MAQSSDTHLAAYTPDDLSVQHESIEQAERWTGIAFELMGHYFVAPLGKSLKLFIRQVIPVFPIHSLG